MRDPSIVMDIKRLSSMHQTCMSFSRSTLREIKNKKWIINKAKFDLDLNGYGYSIYSINSNNAKYNIVIFSQFIEDKDRNDRVIAEKWDITFALVKGEITKERLSHMQENVPLQEKGRNDDYVIILSRANKSKRIFDHIVKSLSKGKQPDLNLVTEVGYVLRTTAVYGNGKFGIVDFNKLQENDDFKFSFSAQMCSLYVLRQFSIDLVNYLAKKEGGDNAVTLDINIQRYIGIGNSTGLGMAPFLVRHPKIINKWITNREIAITRAKNIEINSDALNTFKKLLNKAYTHFFIHKVSYENQQKINLQICHDLKKILVDLDNIKTNSLWQNVIDKSANYSIEIQEIVLACLLEVNSHVTYDLVSDTNIEEEYYLDKILTIGDIQKLIFNRYQWAIKIDFANPENKYWFWYCSSEKSEPRIGIRGIDVGEEKEVFLDIARQINDFYKKIKSLNPKESLAEFLFLNPKYHYIANRIHNLGNSTMGEIQVNILSKNNSPLYLLRCKLSILGATRFSPCSDKWLQVVFFQGAPLLSESNDNSIFPIPQDILA